MRSLFALCPVLLLLICCRTEENNLMLVEGTVEGLKKGMLYLQKFEDTTLVTLDSLKINGNSDFLFKTPLESPEVFYLYLDKNDGNVVNDRLPFFGEPTAITINTTRDFFEGEAQISGSTSQEKLEEYRKIINRFNDENLALIEALFNAEKDGDTITADSIRQRSNKNQMRRYLYSLNFAINNGDSYVAPYIALFEVPDARLKYLDSINRSLSPEVAVSKYGKALEEFIQKIKVEEPPE